MPKRIALFLDGTWNKVNSDTNVWRMKSLCTTGSDQVVYYSTQVSEHSGMYQCPETRPIGTPA